MHARAGRPDPVEDERLLEEAERRWAALAGVRPELREAIALQRRLVERGLALAAAIADVQLPALAGAAGKLQDKRPLLSGADIVLDGAPFEPFVVGFCDDFAHGAAGRPAARVRGALERGAIDVGSLLTASLRRLQTAIRMKANQVGVAPDVLWLVAELAAAPLADRLQRAHLRDAPARDPDLRAALDAWDEGRCPACGSWPALAEETAAARRLRCSFCGGAWQPAVRRCIYCSAGDESFLVAALSPAGEPSRRVELCRACGGYLKSVRADEPAPFALLPVLDLESSDLDAAAVERGYIRFSMREVDAA